MAWLAIKKQNQSEIGMKKRNDEITRDILSLVSKEIPLEVIACWTNEEIDKVEKWASAVIFDASDNSGVKIPEYPEVLKQIQPAAALDAHKAAHQ